MSTTNNFKKGQHYVFFVPPGWILGGTIRNVFPETGEIELQDAVYMEGVNQGKSSIGDVALSKDAKEMTNVITSCYPIPDGTRLRAEALLITVPCLRDLTPLSRKREADAVKGAR